MSSSQEKVRPTKKQRELLTFIAQFIGEHGYSPSYREIMAALEYTSVATVAVHVNNLITRGHLRKRDRSARSLEVVDGAAPQKVATNTIRPDEEKWLVEKVEHFFAQAESSGQIMPAALEQLQVLIATLKIFELEGAAQGFTARLAVLRQRLSE